MAKQQPVGFTDTKRVKELIQLMAENELTEIELVEDKAKITLRRASATIPVAAPVAYAAPVAAPAAHAPAAAPAAAAPAAPAADPDAGLVPIKSPMVGTFYTAANPESDAFVQVGSNVTANTVVCIIEAMKVMNEIKAEVSGVVTQVLVDNAKPVEYGQPLFKIKPR